MTSAKKHARAGVPVVSFFKTMNKSCLAQAAYMPIPEAFYNQHREELLKEGVALERADGKEWEVEVASGAFRSGWKAFSSDNGLKENDMVVFRCCGDRRMSFEVFSVDGCEKQQQLLAQQPRNNKKRSKGFDELENIARQADHSKKARPSNSSGGGGRKLKNGSGKQGGRTTGVDFEHVLDFEQVGSDDETNDEDNACHAKKALESDFAAAADGQKRVKQIIVGVDDDTEIQIVIKKLTPEGSAAALKSKGINTAKNKSPTASTAPVSKASADRIPDALAGTRAKDRAPASKAPASKASVPAAAAGVSKPKRRITKRPATAKAKKVTLNNITKRSRSIKKPTSAQPAKVTDVCAAQVVISDDESQPQQESQRKKSKPQAKPKSQELVHAESVVKASAEALRTDKPSTVIVMKKSNLQPCFFLTVPMVFARTNLPDEIKEFEMVDAADKAWSVRWLGSPKCAFSGGWCYFAQDHNLQMGDACVLELAGPGRIKMHIFKVSDFVSDVAGTQQAVVPIQEGAHEVERVGASPGHLGDEVEVTAAAVAVIEEDDDECVVTVAAAAAAEALEAAEEEDEHDDGDDEDYDPMEDSHTAEDSPVMSNAVENGDEDIE